MAEEKSQKNWFVRHKIVTGILAVVAFFIIIAAIGGSGDTKSGDVVAGEKKQTVETPAESSIKISAIQLQREYEANQVAADQKYKGKILEISGTVKDIGKDILDTPYVSFKTDGLLFTVQCMFSKSDTDGLVSLKQGQSIVLQGKGDGSLVNVIVRNCQIVQ